MMNAKDQLSTQRVENFIETQTSIPTEEEIRRAERALGYPLPNGAESVVVKDSYSFAAKQMLLHPALFRALEEE